MRFEVDDTALAVILEQFPEPIAGHLSDTDNCRCPD